MQTEDEFGVATPADWRPGDDVIIGPAGSCGTANDRMEDSEIDCKDWFFCTKKLDKDTVLDKVLKKNRKHETLICISNSGISANLKGFIPH